MYHLDPASIRMHIAQPLDPYSDMKNLGNHNKDSARFFIRSTNQYVALCTHEYLQDLGIIQNSSSSLNLLEIPLKIIEKPGGHNDLR